MPGVDSCDLASVDTCIDDKSLSQALPKLLFTEEMAFGCATKPRRPGKKNLTAKNFMLSEVTVADTFTFTCV